MELLQVLLTISFIVPCEYKFCSVSAADQVRNEDIEHVVVAIVAKNIVKKALAPWQIALNGQAGPFGRIAPKVAGVANDPAVEVVLARIVQV